MAPIGSIYLQWLKRERMSICCFMVPLILFQFQFGAGESIVLASLSVRSIRFQFQFGAGESKCLCDQIFLY